MFATCILRQNVKEIVSVCPSNTDLCAHLGILDRVVGRDTWSDWPEGEVDEIEVIGPVLNINVKRVVGEFAFLHMYQMKQI
mmetsp:Transcript_24674/g.36181  ORF Transcript_24674/g.36181 Transcript_24674/m.36181 type:complete len:81 (-) Transcript_24674:7-249(-)